MELVFMKLKIINNHLLSWKKKFDHMIGLVYSMMTSEEKIVYENSLQIKGYIYDIYLLFYRFNQIC